MSVVWLRRDLRLADNPALLEAADGTRPVALFVLDPRLWGASGPVRQAYLLRSLRALDASLDGRLLVRRGDPAVVVPEVAAASGATVVHAAADANPYGGKRDATVASALAGAGAELRFTGSPYAVGPGRVRKGDGTPYRVYTPFYRTWVAHGWRRPAGRPDDATKWQIESTGPLASDPLPAEPDLGALELPDVGEDAALARWKEFRTTRLADYADARNRPDVDGTSALSAALRWGEVHPRTLLAALGDSDGHETFRKELAWREFYADVLAQNPTSGWAPLNPSFARMETDSGPLADERLAAWQAGQTGYPLVDAGLRQLLAHGWMHNRLRMIVASFLVKDLHLPWQSGARHFMRYLRDGDLASNSHGWQWVAGCGTDAAPYYRVFNPIAQAKRFDPAGDYVRRFLPELAHVAGAAVHEPWAVADGYAHGYAARIVDHAAERVEALARYQRLRDT